MHTKTHTLYKIILLLILLFSGLTIYLQITKHITKNDKMLKQNFVQSIGLPDLAFYSETPFIRHRSLTDIFAIYQDDGSLREYQFGSFTYNIEKRVIDEK